MITKDEITILQGMIDGKKIRSIAREMGKTESAVKVKLMRMRQRAGSISLYQLIAICVEQRLCKVGNMPVSFQQAQPIEITTGALI